MTYKVKSALLILGPVIAAWNLAPTAKADEWNKETVITFSAPVEVPGKNLPAGTYVFKVADGDSAREIVEIFTKDEQHLVTSFIAIPATRLTPTNTPVVTFAEESTGASEAVKTWFYPGHTEGLEFVYPR